MIQFEIFVIYFTILLIYKTSIVKLELRQPKIFPITEDSTVTPPRFLSLGCQGNANVTWTIPDNSEYWLNTNFDTRVINIKTGEEEVLPQYVSRPQEKINITYINITESNKEPFGALLVLNNVSYNDIGFYYCHELDSSPNDPLRSRKIFIYVREKDKLSFLMKDKIYFINERNNVENITLPCIPTSSNVTVNLLLNIVNYPKISTDIASYVPYVGYIVRKSKTNYRQFICEFRKNDIVETLQMNIRLGDFFDYYVNPFINSSNFIYKNINDDLKLTCAVLTNSNYNVRLIWMIPYKPNPNVQISYTSVPVIRGLLQVITLHVTNLTLIDEGEYICRLNDTLNIDSYVTKKYVRLNSATQYSIPKIYPSEKEYIINSNENLELRCEGNVEMNWIIPKYTLTKPNISSQIKNGKYVLTLKIRSASYYDTGLYSCKNINSNNSQSIFIYVQDEKHLSAYPSSVYKIKADEFTNITIPCVPTSPNIKVSLFDTTTSKLRSELFVPYVGFHLYLPKDNIENLACKFERHNTSQQFNFTIDVRRRYKYEFEPYLSTPDNVVAFTGGDLILMCTVVVRPSFVPNIKWAVPNRPDFFKNKTMNVTESSYLISNGKIVVSTLTLSDIQLGEYREYECSLQDNKNKTRFARKITTINVQFDIKPYIDTERRVAIGDIFNMKCLVRADHNVKFFMNWITPHTQKKKGTEFSNSNYTTDVYGILGNNTLTINNVKRTDEGNYTCVVEDNKKQSKNETVFIKVEDAFVPEFRELINIKNNSKTIRRGSSINFKCLIYSERLPKQTIKWYKDGKVININKTDEFNIKYAQQNDSGVYSCNVTNRLGSVSSWINLSVTSEIFEKGLKIFIGVISGLLVSFLILISMFTVRFLREKRFERKLKSAGLINFEEGQIQSINPNISISDQAELLPYDKKWEIPRDRIKLGKQLGSGEFGVVVKGEVFGIFAGETIKTIAVKMLHKNAEFHYIKALVSELKIMTYLGKHLNVVNLLGACTKNIKKREILIVVEYCPFGNIKNHLLSHRDFFINQIDPETGLVDIDDVAPKLYKKTVPSDNKLENSNSLDSSKQGLLKEKKYLKIEFKTKKIEAESEDKTEKYIFTHDLLCWSYQVARGMDYLSSRRILHGDLAARNILLSDNSVVKICDFGLSKNMYKEQNYKMKSKNPLPIKWMAIESIRDRIFSTQSDVWSYGIVLWEMFSLARTPYPEMESDIQFLENLDKGYRMGQPEYSPKEIYQMMLECWNIDPSKRPTFARLVEDIGSMIHENVKKHYIELNQQYMDLNISEGQVDYLTLINNPEQENGLEGNINDEVTFVQGKEDDSLNSSSCCSSSDFEVRKRIKSNIEVDVHRSME